VSNEYGMVFSQSGVPVEYSEDYQRTVDTRWKPVGIVAEYDVDLTLPQVYTLEFVKILDHNLGYIPAFVAPRQTDYLYPSPQSSPIGATMFYADDTSIYYLRNGKGCRVVGKFYLYDFPINKEYDTGYRGTTMARTTRTDFGVKFSDGYEVNNTDENQLSLNTNIKNLSLAKVGIKRTVSFSNPPLPGIIVNYDIPYPPLVKVSRKLEDNAVIIQYPSIYLRVPKETWSALALADNNAYVNAGTIHQATIGISSLGSVTETDIAYVILRDPSDIAS